MNHISQVVDLIRSGLNPGQPRSSHGLTLVPLFGGDVAKEYLTAAEASAAGLLTITEVEGGSVPQVAAVNSAELPVLLLDGEHIEGAMQNRILNSSALIAARHKTILPVACVESGRWHYEASDDSGGRFDLSDDFAYSRLRSKNAAAVASSARAVEGRQVDQGEVWEDVALKHHERLMDSSETGAMRDAYDVSRGEINAILEDFKTLEPGQTGVIAAVAGRCVALDAFDRPETLSKLWPRLLPGYAMDALDTPFAPLEDGTAQRFLDAAAGGETTSHSGIGLGMDVMVTSPTVVGHALTWESGVIHLALFAKSDDGHRTVVDGGQIESPLSRRRFM